jgi:hypothetical protein
MSLQQLCSNIISNDVLNNDNIDYIDKLNIMCKRKVIEEINLIEKIRKIIDNMFNYIIDGYTIIESSIYDCDEYGYIYDVYCKNGFDGQKHYIRPTIYYDKMIFIKQLVDYGIYIDGIRYYIHESILFDISKIKFINETEFLIRKERTNNILENINKIKQIHKSKLKSWKYISTNKYDLLYCYNKDYFYKSLYILENFSSISYKKKIEFSNSYDLYFKRMKKYFDHII